MRSRLEPRDTDRSRHWLGSLGLPAGSESLIVLVYGDNRLGYRMETRSVEFHAVRNLTWNAPGHWLRGLAYLPAFLVEAIIPALDGPRDIVTRFTHRFSGGREKAVLKALGHRSSAQLVINLGDLVTDGRRGRLWEDFVTRHASLRGRVLYLAAPGNHERMWTELGRGNWDAAVGQPARHERYWYAVDVPEAGARFVFLDSSLLADPRHNYPDSLEETLSDEQLAWADSVLDSPGRFRFILLHHPLVSAGHHVDDWGSDHAARRLARLLEMCVKRRVTAVLASHEHLYQRVYLRTQDGAGFWQLTTGGGGSPLYHVSPGRWREALARPLAAGLSVDLGSAFKKSEYHICRLALPLSPSAQASLPVEVDRVYANGSTRRMDAFDLGQPPSHR